MGDVDKITTFDLFKKTILEKIKDYSLEPHIKECVHTLNKHPHIVTTSSCEGHGVGSIYSLPVIWGIIESFNLLNFIYLLGKTQIHFAIYNIELMKKIQGIDTTEMRNVLFFKLRIPEDVPLEKARQQFNKLTKIVKELV